MTAKKKVVIAVSSFVVLILAAVIVVVSVLAATSITINSSINVTYHAREIVGTVTAQYQVAGDENPTNIGKGVINFTGEELEGEDGYYSETMNNAQNTVNIENLTRQNNYVDFIFTFTNTGESDYFATVTLPQDSDNFEVFIPDNTLTVQIQKGTTEPFPYRVRYTVKNVSKSATLSGDFVWSLTSVNI